MKKVSGRLEIVGDGPLRNDLYQVARDAALSDRVVFRGFISEEELLELYDMADILVLPSTDEGEAFGYVLVEAMASRTAVISTELGTGTSYVNQHGKTGLVIPPNNVDALVNALQILLSNKHILKEMKNSAYQRVKSNFTIDRMLNETEALLRSL
jgi:rhamnosyl/mannosyltransferase